MIHLKYTKTFSEEFRNMSCHNSHVLGLIFIIRLPHVKPYSFKNKIILFVDVLLMIFKWLIKNIYCLFYGINVSSVNNILLYEASEIMILF